jgi:hypothetical protein
MSSATAKFSFAFGYTVLWWMCSIKSLIRWYDIGIMPAVLVVMGFVIL